MDPQLASAGLLKSFRACAGLPNPAAGAIQPALHCVAEALGTCALLYAAITAHILTGRAAWPDKLGIELAGIAYATVFGILIALCPCSLRLYFNPALCLARVVRSKLSLPLGLAYAGSEIAGAFAGVAFAQWSLNLDTIQAGVSEFPTVAVVLSEVFAAALFTAAVSIAALSPARWPLASTSAGVSLGVSLVSPHTAFANPAAALALTLTSNALGLSPGGAAAFAFADLFGALLAAVAVDRALTA